MAAATVSVGERNGTDPGTPTESITNMNWGSADVVNLTTTSYRITPGNYSFDKYQWLNVTDIGTDSAVDNIRVYKQSGTIPGAAAIWTNATQGIGTTAYAGAQAYATPSASQNANCIFHLPEDTPPGSANLGISGSLSGSLTAAGDSDYLLTQVKTDSGDTTGVTNLNIRWLYDRAA